MDSQEQYEALLARWGYEDRSVERRLRREKRKALFAKVIKLLRNTPNRKPTIIPSH